MWLVEDCLCTQSRVCRFFSAFFDFKLSWPLCGPSHVLPFSAVDPDLSLLSFLCSCLDKECRVSYPALPFFRVIYPSGSLFFLFTSWIYCIVIFRLGNIVLGGFPSLETPSNRCQALFHSLYMLSNHRLKSRVGLGADSPGRGTERPCCLFPARPGGMKMKCVRFQSLLNSSPSSFIITHSHFTRDRALHFICSWISTSG